MELKELYQTLVETEKDFQRPPPPLFFKLTGSYSVQMLNTCDSELYMCVTSQKVQWQCKCVDSVILA